MPQDKQHQQGARHGAKATRGAAPLVGAALVLAIAVAIVAVVLTAGGDDADDRQVSAPTPGAAGGAVSWTAEPFSGGPRLAVDQTRVDRGAVDYGTPVEAIYRLKNVGDEELRIGQTSVNTLEGC